MKWLLDLYPGDWFFELAVNSVLQAFVITGIALLVSRFFLRRKPALRHAVWLSALVCVFLSPLLAWTWSTAGVSFFSIELSGTGSVKSYEDVVIPDETGSEKAPASDGETQDVTKSGEGAENAGILAASASGSERIDALRLVLAALFVVWAAGALFYTIRLIYGFGVHAALRRAVQPLEMEYADKVLEEVREILGVKRLPFAGTSVLINSPVSIGMSNPMVILPQSLAYALDEDELRDVLVHEYAHILNRDHFVNLIQRLTAIFMWFHPFVRRLNRELAQAREEVCDNYVLRKSRATSYSRTLLELAQKTTLFHRAPVTVGLAHPRWKLEDRVKGLLDKGRELKTNVGSVVFGTIATIFLSTVIVIAACRIVSAGQLSEEGTNTYSTIIDSFGIDRLPEGEKQIVEKEVSACRKIYEELFTDEEKRELLKLQVLKSSEELRKIKNISYHLVATLSRKTEGARGNIIALLLGGTAGLATSAIEVDTILLTRENGIEEKVKMALDENRNSTILSNIESKLVSLDVTPVVVLCLLSHDDDSKISLRASAVAALGERRAVESVGILIELLQNSQGPLMLETARNLRILTGEDFGPDKDSSLQEAQRAILEWLQWWIKNRSDGRYRLGD